MTESEEEYFNEKELRYLSDKDFLLSKHSITSKIFNLFQEVEDRISHIIAVEKYDFPDDVLQKTGKISKGENYRLLPYLILDYPRYFNTQAVFAFRTMFWWGNFYSCTLHLQGTILDAYRLALKEQVDILKNKNFFIAVGKSPWEYHYEAENYLSIDVIDHSELLDLIKNKKFIKLSRNINLEEHWSLPSFAEETFYLLMKSIKI